MDFENAAADIENAVERAMQQGKLNPQSNFTTLAITPNRTDLAALESRCKGREISSLKLGSTLLGQEIHPFSAILHALDHDLNSAGIYNLDESIARFCRMKDNCPVITPAELMLKLYRLRLTKFAQKAHQTWQQTRQEPKIWKFLSEDDKAIAKRNRGQYSCSLSMDAHTPLLNAYFGCDTFSAQALIDITEPEDPTVLFNTQTSISMGQGDQHKNYALISPHFPATAATITSIVMSQVKTR